MNGLEGNICWGNVAFVRTVILLCVLIVDVKEQAQNGEEVQEVQEVSGFNDEPMDDYDYVLDSDHSDENEEAWGTCLAVLI